VCCWLWTLCHTIQHRAVLIIFPLYLQTITITPMLSSGGEGSMQVWSYSIRTIYRPNLIISQLQSYSSGLCSKSRHLLNSLQLQCSLNDGTLHTQTSSHTEPISSSWLHNRLPLLSARLQSRWSPGPERRWPSLQKIGVALVVCTFLTSPGRWNRLETRLSCYAEMLATV